MVFEEKHHMPWAYEAYDVYDAYEPNFRENVVNAFHRLRTVEGIHDQGTGERRVESSVPKRMDRIASMAILGSRRMDSRPFVSCMTSVNCV